MKKYLQICFVTLLMCTNFVVIGQKTTVTVKPTVQFYNVSDNGKYAVGNIGVTLGLVYNIEKDIIIYLSKDGSGEESQANDVTNDGLVFGSFNKHAAYFDIDWEAGTAEATALPLPEGTFEESDVMSVTPDGKYAGGSLMTPSWTGYPLKWDLTAGTVEALKFEEKIYTYGVMNCISVDGTKGVGRVIYDNKYVVGAWNNSVLDKFIPSVFTDDCLGAEVGPELNGSGSNSDMSKIVGRYTSLREDENGFIIAATYPYIHNYITKETNFLTEYAAEYGAPAFTAISDNDIILGVQNGGGFPCNGTAMVYDNQTMYQLTDWLAEFYANRDLKSFLISGIPYAITPDGKTIVGTGYDADDNIAGYIIKIGDKMICPKISALKAEAIGNETVSLTWAAPTEYMSPILGYNVYRNDILLTKTPIKTLSYSEMLLDGTYCYTIEAMYENSCSSGKSEPACVEIYKKGSCYAPTDLSGSLTADNKAELKWEYPSFDLTYTQNIGENAVGFEGIDTPTMPFYFGSKIVEKKIQEKQLDGLSITDVSFYVNGMADYDIVIFTNETHIESPEKLSDEGSVEIYRQELRKSQIEDAYDSYATFKLDTPVVIDIAKKNYYISIYCHNYEPGVFPGVYDNGPLTKSWESDLLAYEPSSIANISWISFTSVFSVQGNWVLSAKISPKKGSDVSISIPEVPSKYDKMLESYSILRDGVEIAKAKTNAFTDASIEQGIDYNYTVKANYIYNCISDVSNVLSIKSLSVNELESEVKVYPNPVDNGTLYVSTNYDSVTISDIQGRIVLHQEGGANDNIDVSQLKHGMYLVKICTNGANITKKIMIK